MTGKTQRIEWPDGKDFAFTIFDDSDCSSLENTREVYRFLEEHGFRTTKTVWPLRGKKAPHIGGTTCDDPAYVGWLKSLYDKGFEISYHSATYHSSDRETIHAALDRFKELFGDYPVTMANHAFNRENMYWGDARFTGVRRVAYNLLTKGQYRNVFSGHIPDDDHFWGDMCREKIRYVRNFVFNELNSLKVCPFMPYHDPLRPFVNRWFASANGDWVKVYNELLSEDAQDRLEKEGGAAIVTSHLAKGFYDKNELNQDFVRLMKRLASKNGWFVPASEMLDHIAADRGEHIITPMERAGLEGRWLIDQLHRTEYSPY